MTKCKRCGVEIGDSSKVCPMCEMVLSGDYTENENSYPDIRTKRKFWKTFINIVTYISIVIQIILFVINYYNYNGVKWSLITGGVIVYFILTLQYTANRRNGHIKKIFVQMLGAIFVEIFIDYAMGGTGWSLTYGIPCTVLLIDVVVVVCSIINIRNWQNYILMQLFALLVSILQMILYFVQVVENPVLPWVTFGVTAVIFTSSFVIGGKTARTELKRRFYI